MQISSSYTLNSIFDISSPHMHYRNSTATTNSHIDTVSISDAARAAYKNANTQKNDINDAQLEAKLITFFNMWHSEPDFPVNKNIHIEYGSEILPENKILKNSIEKEIDRIFDEFNYKVMDGVAPDELMNKIRPLQQKLNAISALGDLIVLDEATLNNSANFLQELENTWSKAVDEDTSLAGKFHSATHAWKEQPQTEEEIRKKIEEKKSEAIDSLLNSDF